MRTVTIADVEGALAVATEHHVTVIRATAPIPACGVPGCKTCGNRAHPPGHCFHCGGVPEPLLPARDPAAAGTARVAWAGTCRKCRTPIWADETPRQERAERLCQRCGGAALFRLWERPGAPEPLPAPVREHGCPPGVCFGHVTVRAKMPPTLHEALISRDARGVGQRYRAALDARQTGDSPSETSAKRGVAEADSGVSRDGAPDRRLARLPGRPRVPARERRAKAAARARRYRARRREAEAPA